MSAGASRRTFVSRRDRLAADGFGASGLGLQGSPTGDHACSAVPLESLAAHAVAVLALPLRQRPVPAATPPPKRRTTAPGRRSNSAGSCAQSRARHRIRPAICEGAVMLGCSRPALQVRPRRASSTSTTKRQHTATHRVVPMSVSPHGDSPRTGSLLRSGAPATPMASRPQALLSRQLRPVRHGALRHRSR